MAVSQLDVLCSFAQVAEDFNYCMPEVDDSGIIDIKDGRHPVIEKMLPSGAFVANDTYLDKESNRVSIITGPNMAGKSTYMRQVALITLMAQIGIRSYQQHRHTSEWLIKSSQELVHQMI